MSGADRAPDDVVRSPDNAGQRAAQARVIACARAGMARAERAGMTKHSRIASTLAPTLACVVVAGLAVALAVALTGCSDSAALVPPPAVVDAPPPPAATLFALNSELDLGDQLPGAVGSAVGELIDATDDPDDPTKYIVDRIIAQMADGTAKDIAEAAEPFVTAYVNQRLLADSPQLLAKLVALGRGFGDAARQLGTMDTLAIAPDGSAVHAIIGVRVQLDSEVVELGFDDHGLAPVSAGVTLHATVGQLALARHTLALPLGQTLRLVIDGAVVPHVDPGAVDLIGLLQNAVDCTGFGSAMAEALGFGSADGYTAACHDALTDVATTFYSELAATDADMLELDVSGTADAIDRDGDGRVDELDEGRWLGTVSYAGAQAPLASGTFSGTRVAD
jgi:hypothetical protein